MRNSGLHPPCTDGSHRYLIIAGAYKSGTTSLYTWLKHHPQVCAAAQKETWFFSPRELHPNPTPRYDGDLGPYLALFRDPAGTRLRVEGTPFYLYSAQTAEWIKRALPHSRIVVILGDPVWRLDSWYRMAATYGYFGETPPGLEQYLRLMREDPRPPEQRPPHLRCLEHGRYAPYLRQYIEIFGRERVQVLWFEELAQQPLRAMRRLCRFAGLDPGFYEDYLFEAQHRALELKRRQAFLFYVGIKNGLRALLPSRHPGRRLLRRARESLDWLMFPYLFKDAQRVAMSQAVQRELRTYYAADAAELVRLLGEPPPWLAGEPRQAEAAVPAA
jgi:hypothetical protein